MPAWRRIDGGPGEAGEQPEVVTYENLHPSTDGAIVRDEVSVGDTTVNIAPYQLALVRQEQATGAREVDLIYRAEYPSPRVTFQGDAADLLEIAILERCG